MARGINLSDLAALPNDATLVAGQEINATEPNAHRRKVQSLVNNLLTALRDKEGFYAGAGQPIRKVRGKGYFDTDDSLWKGYKADAGTPVAWLESGAAYARGLSNAGTDTLKVGGVLDVDTADVPASDIFTSLLANTAGEDGVVLQNIGWASIAMSSGTGRCTVLFGSLGQASNDTAAAASGNFLGVTYAVRTSETTAKACGAVSGSNDNIGSILGVNANDGSAGFTSNLTFRISTAVVSGAGTLTTEGAALMYQ